MTNTLTTAGPFSDLHIALATLRNRVLPKLEKMELCQHIYTLYNKLIDS